MGVSKSLQRIENNTQFKMLTYQYVDLNRVSPDSKTHDQKLNDV